MITNKVKIALISGAAAIIAAIITAVVTVKTNPGNTGNSSAEANARNSNTVILNPQGVPVTPQADLEDVSIVVLDADTGAPVLGAVITVTGPGGKVILQNQSAATGQRELSALEMSDYTVKVSAEDYGTEERSYNLHAVLWEVRLKKIPPPALPAIAPYSFAGWNPWGGLTASRSSNTVTLKGEFTTAGYVATGIRGLGGRRLILDIAGTTTSTFHDGQLFKLETEDGRALMPEEILGIIGDGYIPAIDGRVTYAIPGDFGGRLNIVFYKAELDNLRISAFIE